jgi:hypothetical protein
LPSVDWRFEVPIGDWDWRFAHWDCRLAIETLEPARRWHASTSRQLSVEIVNQQSRSAIINPNHQSANQISIGNLHPAIANCTIPP